MQLPDIKLYKHKALQSLLIVSLVLAVSYLAYKQQQIEVAFLSLNSGYSNLQDNLKDELFKDHLLVSQKFALESQVNSLQAEINEVLAQGDNEELQKIQSIFDNYQTFNSKFSRNNEVSLDTSDYSDKVDGWGKMLIEKDLDNLLTDIQTANTQLDVSHAEYIAALPPPPTSAEGYSYVTVSTSKGTFGVHLIKMPLSSVKVVTASAAGENCKDNCPTKSLAQHVSDNGGFAGMNGTYFCPPDYSECGGKVNSFDYAVYKSSSGKWLNSGALSWGDTGLATFNGNSAKFYKRTSDYGGGGVTAGISNYPTLLRDGKIVTDEGVLTSYQKTARGPRGVIGMGKTNLYLAIINRATVIEAAYAAQALGMLQALNLDGGGSTAMYINGGYIAGPGRSLPNAVVLTR